MAKEKISELDPAAALDGTELVPVVQDGETVKTTAQDIADLAGGGASYLVYTALLSQTGTDDPVATVLENTLGGTVVWTRNDIGEYAGTLAGAFTENKTFFASLAPEWEIDSIQQANLSRTNGDSVKLYTELTDGTTSDVYHNLCIEIRVYP